MTPKNYKTIEDLHKHFNNRPKFEVIEGGVFSEDRQDFYRDMNRGIQQVEIPVNEIYQY